MKLSILALSTAFLAVGCVSVDGMASVEGRDQSPSLRDYLHTITLTPVVIVEQVDEFACNNDDGSVSQSNMCPTDTNLYADQMDSLNNRCIALGFANIVKNSLQARPLERTQDSDSKVTSIGLVELTYSCQMNPRRTPAAGS